MLVTLTSCASSGSLDRASLPPIPADIRLCFDAKVEPPPQGRAMTKQDVYDKLGEFVVLDEKKTSCGKRLIARDDALVVGKVQK